MVPRLERIKILGKSLTVKFELPCMGKQKWDKLKHTLGDQKIYKILKRVIWLK